jgi:hypothetical protein
MKKWLSIPRQERRELRNAYKEAGYSYMEAVRDIESDKPKFGGGGKMDYDFYSHQDNYKSPEAIPKHAPGMEGMMKSAMATSAHYGNKGAQRMVSANPKTGMTPEGDQGTHYISSYGQYAIPGLQDNGGRNLDLEKNLNNPSPKEAMRFNNERDAHYFTENYKDVAPMMRNWNNDPKYARGGRLPKFDDGGNMNPWGQQQVPQQDNYVMLPQQEQPQLQLTQKSQPQQSNTRQFNNIMQKQQYWDTMPDKYGEHVKNRQVFMDIYNTPFNEAVDGFLYQDKFDVDPITDSGYHYTSKVISGPFQVSKSTEDNIKRSNELVKVLKENSKDFYVRPRNPLMPTRLITDIQKDTLSRLNKTNINIPANEDLGHRKETQHTWEDMLKNLPPDISKSLFFTSMLEEGLQRQLGNGDSTMRFPASGFYTYGLDRIGDRLDEFIKKGYLDEGIRDRVVSHYNSNEKGERVHSLDFMYFKDVMDSKIAFIRSSKDELDKFIKKENINLSDQAKDFFTVVGYNMGDEGMKKMIQSYKDSGYLDNDRFLREPPPSYQQPYKHAMRRVQSARMLEGEQIIR